MPKSKTFCSENSLDKVHINTKWEEGKSATKYFWEIYSSKKMFIDKDRREEKPSRKEKKHKKKPQSPERSGGEYLKAISDTRPSYLISRSFQSRANNTILMTPV